MASMVSNVLINDVHKLYGMVAAEIETVGEATGVLQEDTMVQVEEALSNVDELCLEGNSVSEPEPKLLSEVLTQEKDYFIEDEGDVAKRKYNKKQFEKRRSSSRVHTRATKSSL